MNKTLFLHPETWDLALDVEGNIAMATDTYQKAQDISSACRTFKKDVYHRQEDGIPYSEEVLGKGKYSLALYRKHLNDAALSIQGVTEVNAELYPLKDRGVTGRILFADEDGQKGVIGL
ncbi:hypothetical protein RMB03_17350 [Acinetobacter sp. V91_7]|uniref:hypothetical protein n=1 Tax=unclassified Acinetobacter TaxID=196816 RepID=UPI00287F1A21|nr:MULTISPECIES: hypothetical protein [unclassified Acinetobacter]MDS7935677.1 hypothetical protein [Acinetobacter sp. V91_4B]MDS7964715.1 hypothetical protein [Acinetobacter sp. V91_7]MDS8025590.1 hypothetical protein [Acinetobacter sp. V91_13]